MKERPILFSAPMVRAILEGRKTQTRRVVKPQPDTTNWKAEAIQTPKVWRPIPCLGPGHHLDENTWGLYNSSDGSHAVPYTGRKCPYGQPGDRLWVRETWAPTRVSVSHEYGDVCYFPWEKSIDGPIEKDSPYLQLFYCADGEDELPSEFTMPTGSEIPWKPSIHMPRWASRITLEITDIRVERVKELSEKDAQDEGVDLPDGCMSPAYRMEFRDLWDSINAARGFGWDKNPWVWVIEFK